MSDHTQRVLTKRKLDDLVSTVSAKEGISKPVLENDAEELVYDLADEFVSSITSFACRIAKTRKIQKVEIRDFQLLLERDWNIRIPGYSTDDVKAIKKDTVSEEYKMRSERLRSERLERRRLSGQQEHSTAVKQVVE